MKVKVAQSCPTICNGMGYTVHGILQPRLLEWVAFPSPGDLHNPGVKSRSPTLQVDSLPSKQQGKPKNTGVGHFSSIQSLSHVRLFATPWTVAYQASPSMGFSRQEYWSGLAFPSPGDLPDPGIEPKSPAFGRWILYH